MKTGNGMTKISATRAQRRAPWARHLAAGTALGVVLTSGTAAATGQATEASATMVQQAQAIEARRFDIPAQPLADALTVFGRQAGLQVTLEAAIVQDLAAPAVMGTMAPEEALRRLLAGSGITWHFPDDHTVALEKVAAEPGSTLLDPLVVETDAPPPPSATIGTLPPEYAGGQVARGGNIGVLGNHDIMDVPFSMTSYTSNTVRNQQAESIADVVANDPSVRSAYGFGNFAEVFVVRGFPLFGEDVAIDGLYGNAPRQIVATEMYERVEVLKGASAFLNGMPPAGSGTGGSINLVPKRAGDEPLTRLTGSYAQDTRVGGHVDFARRFGRDDMFGLRVNGAARDGTTAVDDEERYTHLGSIAFDYRGEDTRFTLDAASQRQRIDQGRPVVFVTGTSVPDAPDSRHNYARSFTYSELTDSFAQAKIEHDITPALTAYAQVGLRYMEEEGDYSSVTVTDAAGNGTSGRLFVPRDDVSKSGQLGLRGELETGPVLHRFNLGLAALRTTNNNSFIFGADSPTNLYDPIDAPLPPTIIESGDLDNPPKVSGSTLQSAFASDTLSFYDERVLVLVGLRAQKVLVDEFDRTTQDKTNEYDESAVSPVVGIVVKPLPELSLYANRIEGLAQGDTAPSGTVNAGEIFPPFKSTQYEVGAKLDLGDLGASLAFFQTTQPSGITDPVTNEFSVDGEQRNRGIEFMLYGEPVEGLRLLGGATFNDAILTKTAGGDFDGNDAVGVPRYQANVGAEWDLPFLERATVSARALYTGTQFLDEANDLKVPAWTRFDLGARLVRTISGRDVAFILNVENVTDLDYWASAQGGYLTQGRPLTAKLSVSVDF